MMTTQPEMMTFKTTEVKKNYFTMMQVRHSLNMILSEMSGLDWKPHIVLGINRGGCVPGIYLSHALDIPHETLDIRPVSYTHLTLPTKA